MKGSIRVKWNSSTSLLFIQTRDTEGYCYSMAQQLRKAKAGTDIFVVSTPHSRLTLAVMGPDHFWCPKATATSVCTALTTPDNISSPKHSQVPLEPTKSDLWQAYSYSESQADSLSPKRKYHNIHKTDRWDLFGLAEDFTFVWSVMMIDRQKMDKKKQKKSGICGYHPENEEHILKKK